MDAILVEAIFGLNGSHISRFWWLQTVRAVPMTDDTRNISVPTGLGSVRSDRS